MSWYVLYKERAVNALQRLDDRDSALSTAFALAYGGHELIELGPIGGSGGEAVAGAAMTRLLAEYAGGGLPGADDRAGGSVRRHPSPPTVAARTNSRHAAAQGVN